MWWWQRGNTIRCNKGELWEVHSWIKCEKQQEGRERFPPGRWHLYCGTINLAKDFLSEGADEDAPTTITWRDNVLLHPGSLDTGQNVKTNEETCDPVVNPLQLELWWTVRTVHQGSEGQRTVLVKTFRCLEAKKKKKTSWASFIKAPESGKGLGKQINRHDLCWWEIGLKLLIIF